MCEVVDGVKQCSIMQMFPLNPYTHARAAAKVVLMCLGAGRASFANIGIVCLGAGGASVAALV